MALSPSNASRAGLLARQAAKRDTTASTLIHAIVRVCTRWIRRIASGEAICSTEAIGLSIYRTVVKPHPPLRKEASLSLRDFHRSGARLIVIHHMIDPSAHGKAAHQPGIIGLQEIGRRTHIPLGRFAVASIRGDNWYSAAQWRVKWKEHGLDT